MFALISDISNYKSYLPWCKNSDITSIDNYKLSDIISAFKLFNIDETLIDSVDLQDISCLTGKIDLSYLKVSFSFATKNINIQDVCIIMQLIDGPFKHLSGLWMFNQLGHSGCKIEFDLAYEFTNAFIDKAFNPAFHHISSKLIDSFIMEAKNRFGK